MLRSCRNIFFGHAQHGRQPGASPGVGLHLKSFTITKLLFLLAARQSLQAVSALARSVGSPHAGSGLKTTAPGNPGRHRGILTRIRHLRGHGIHSPFVYGLVRTVFTRCGWVGADRSVYDMLRENGVGRSAARQLQNLSAACRFVRTSAGFRTDGGMCVILRDDKATAGLIAENTGTTFVVVAPYRGRGRIDACFGVAGTGTRLTIDTRRFFIIFNERQMPHQHFKL